MRRFSIFDNNVSSFDLHSVNAPKKLTTIYFSLDSSKCNLRILQPIHQPEFSFYTTLAIVEIHDVRKSSRLESTLLSSISTICSIGNVVEKCLHILRNALPSVSSIVINSLMSHFITLPACEHDFCKDSCSKRNAFYDIWRLKLQCTSELFCLCAKSIIVGIIIKIKF